MRASAFLRSPDSHPAPRRITATTAMARPIGEGYTSVPSAPALALAAMSTLAFLDGRTVWDELCAHHGLSANAARMLRPGRAGLEFAAFFVRCTQPWLQGFRSPGGQSWLVCPRALRVNDLRALLARTRPGGRTPTTLFGGWRRCPPGGAHSGPSTRSKPARATTIRCLATSMTRTSRTLRRPGCFDGHLRAWHLQLSGVLPSSPGALGSGGALPPPPWGGRRGRQVWAVESDRVLAMVSPEWAGSRGGSGAANAGPASIHQPGRHGERARP